MYIKWTKLFEIENRSLFIKLLHVVEMIRLRLCIKFVHNDCMLKNKCSCYFKLLQQFYFHHHSCCYFEIFHDQNNYLIVYNINVLKHSWLKMYSVLLWFSIYSSILDFILNFILDLFFYSQSQLSLIEFSEHSS